MLAVAKGKLEDAKKAIKNVANARFDEPATDRLKVLCVTAEQSSIKQIVFKIFTYVND